MYDARGIVDRSRSPGAPHIVSSYIENAVACALKREPRQREVCLQLVDTAECPPLMAM